MCVGCRYCYTAAKGRDRSVWLTLLSTLIVLAAWPLIGAFQIQDFPYPLTVTMFVNLIIMVIGMVLYLVECCVYALALDLTFLLHRRGFTCFPPKREPGYEEPSLDEEGEEKGALTPCVLLKRMVHWAMFSGLFLTIFVYASTIAQEPCAGSPNLCTVLFRSCLFLTCVMALAAIRSERRGGRLDWAVAFILSIGISLLLWNNNNVYKINFEEEFGVLVGGALVMLSFSVILISLRRGVQGSSIAKTVWITSVYGFITMVGLSSFFEGATPWEALAAGGFGLVWRVLAVMGILIVWVWFTVMALAFSETIVVALALQFSLLLGDMGIHRYIWESWTFSGTFIAGLVGVCIGFLWFLKRVITLNCPNICGNACNFANEEADDDSSDDMNIELETRRSGKGYTAISKNRRYGEEYLEKYRKEQGYGTVAPPKRKAPSHW